MREKKQEKYESAKLQIAAIDEKWQRKKQSRLSINDKIGGLAVSDKSYLIL